MSNAKLPVTIFTGQRAQVRMVARSFGLGAPAMVEGVDFTPNLANQVVMAFGKTTPVLNYTTFDDVTAKLSYVQNNQAILEAMVMDADPTKDEIFVNPSSYIPFVCFANLAGLDGKIKGSYLLRGCTVVGNPWTSTVKEGAKRTLDFKALNAYFFHGLGINYTRFRGANTIQPPPGIPVLTPSGVGGFLGPDTYYVQITAVTAAGETTPSNEAVVQITSGTTNEITVTTPAIVAPVTAYNVYVLNRSNGELLVGQVTAGTSFVITALPGGNAGRPPIQNTSGMPVTSGDVVLTAGGGLFTAAFPVPAFKLAQTGLPYVLIHKNGNPIADLDDTATEDTFAIDAAGANFTVLDANGANDWFDVFTLYKP